MANAHNALGQLYYFFGVGVGLDRKKAMYHYTDMWPLVDCLRQGIG